MSDFSFLASCMMYGWRQVKAAILNVKEAILNVKAAKLCVMAAILYGYG